MYILVALNQNVRVEFLRDFLWSTPLNSVDAFFVRRVSQHF